MNYSIRDIQTKLIVLGYEPGPVDGIRGRRTINAVKAFQKANNLRVDGIAGENTLGVMFRTRVTPNASPDKWPWLTEGLRVLGWHEVTDFNKLSAWLRSDGRALGDPRKLPWCGDFVETCILRSLQDESVPAHPYFARNWQSFGVATTPRMAAVMVFSRGANGGHVGFYVGETASYFIILGGNQSNSVSKSRVAKGRLLAARWPETARQITTERFVVTNSDIGITTNEE